MKRFRVVLAAVALAALTAFALVTPGCSKQGVQRVAGPSQRPDPGLTDFTDARWLTAPDELRQEEARAARSPLMAQAVRDQASDPNLSLLLSGVMGAVGTAKNGNQVRVTLLPYQYGNDPNHAVYFAILEVNGVQHVESFELIRDRKPTVDEAGFERVNEGDHGIWMRGGPIYVQASNGGVIRRAPERFNWARFGGCFVPLADRLLGEVQDTCHSMGDFPGCVSVGSSAALLGAGLYCAAQAWNG